MTSSEPGSEPKFEVIATHHDYFLAPDGTKFDQAWWDPPIQPTKHIPLEKCLNLIDQIDEQGGKQSCWLTSQLNAWVLRDLLDPIEAARVQDLVSRDPQFSGYWIDQAPWGKDYVAWGSRPGDTAYVVLQITGKRMAYSLTELSDDPVQQVGDVLGQGFAVVLNGDNHSRTAFQPANTDRIFVFDPKYMATTGLRDLPSALQLQTDRDFLVV